MRASGTVGELRVGYQRAAALGAWTIQQEARVPCAYAFRGTVVSEHPYWSQQRPLDLVLAVGATEWVWRDVAVTRDGAEVTIALAERPVTSDRLVVNKQHKERQR